jgi:hypothetical protein
MKKNNQILFSTFFITIIFVTSSCRYHNKEDLFPIPISTCDTTQVTYSGTIIPILNDNCYRCHGTTTNTGSGGIILQDYNVLKGFAADGKFYGDAAHLPGYIPMPYDGGKLSDCDLQKVKKWVDNGYPNN